MIKIKNSQLSNDTIQALNTLIEMDINAVSAFRLTRIIKELSSIIEDKVKLERKILDKWIEKDENGSPVRPLNEFNLPVEGAVNIIDMESFNKEMSDLMAVENDISYDKLKFEELNLSTAKIKDLMKIEFLFI